MPTYELECADCGLKFEKFLSFADKDNALCPSCGSAKLRQNYSSHILLKKGSNCSASSCASCSSKCAGR